MEATSQEEKVFYRDEVVTVTQAGFIVGSKTYAIRNISSVSNFRIEKSIAFAIVLIVVGLLMLFGNSSTIIFGILAIALGILLIVKTKDDFSVRISTNAGETQALINKDREYIQKIVDALNEAIIHRG